MRADEAWREKVKLSYAAYADLMNDEHLDVIEVEDRNRAFHQALLSRCESRWLLNIVTMLSDHCIRYRLMSLKERGGRKGALEEHKALYEACMRGDVDAAARLLENHIDTTLKSLISILQEMAPGEED
jgi:DNA-binding GntR family transcriptional regulator